MQRERGRERERDRGRDTTHTHARAYRAAPVVRLDEAAVHDPMSEQLMKVEVAGRSTHGR
jgi:hypothetical protein